MRVALLHGAVTTITCRESMTVEEEKDAQPTDPG
jgi:hypothetical protein